jgi:hypothetical protein
MARGTVEKIRSKDFWPTMNTNSPLERLSFFLSESIASHQRDGRIMILSFSLQPDDALKKSGFPSDFPDILARFVQFIAISAIRFHADHFYTIVQIF